MESPCAVSLIVVGSITLFTVGCGCIVNWVLCLLCGWIFHCVVCGTERHLLYCWSEFYYVEFLRYRGPYENSIRRFYAKVGREIIFKPTIGNESLHQDSNDNGVRIVHFAT